MLRRLWFTLAFLLVPSLVCAQGNWVTQNGQQTMISTNASTVPAVKITQQNTSACTLELTSGGKSLFKSCSSGLSLSAGVGIDGATPSTHGIKFAAGGATPSSTSSALYSPNGTDLYFNGTILSTGATGTSLNITDDTTTNATMYPGWVAAASGTTTAVKVSSTKMSFNPSTGVLTASGGVSTGTLATSGTYTPAGRVVVPMGEVSYFNTTGTAVTISGTSDGSTNMVVVAPTSTGNFDADFNNGGGNTGRLRYTGATTRMFHVALTVSGTPSQNNDVFVFGIAKNGTPVAASKVLSSFTGTQTTAIHLFISLATNDYLEMYIGNMTAARNITIKSINLFAMGM